MTNEPANILIAKSDLNEMVMDSWRNGFQQAIDSVWWMANEVENADAKFGIQAIACALENLKP